MSGLYNTLFGYHQNVGFLLNQLGFVSGAASVSDVEDVIPRFRDCYMVNDEIIIYTRTGGDNRERYDGKSSDDYAGPTNDDLRQNPYYLRDEDCAADETYCVFYFKQPEQLRDMLQKNPALLDVLSAPLPAERWAHAMTELAKDEKQDENLNHSD